MISEPKALPPSFTSLDRGEEAGSRAHGGGRLNSTSSEGSPHRSPGKAGFPTPFAVSPSTLSPVLKRLTGKGSHPDQVAGGSSARQSESKPESESEPEPEPEPRARAGASFQQPKLSLGFSQWSGEKAPFCAGPRLQTKSSGVRFKFPPCPARQFDTQPEPEPEHRAGAGAGASFQQPKLSLGFSQWSGEKAPFTATPRLQTKDSCLRFKFPPRPARQFDTSRLSQLRWWREPTETLGASDCKDKQRVPSPVSEKTQGPRADDRSIDCKHEENSELEDGELFDVSEAPMDQAVHPPRCGSQHGASRLIDLPIQDLGDGKVLFYFGVLATHVILLPRIQFSEVPRRYARWGVKLTMYGHTIDASPQYDSQEAARVDACRTALEVLKAEYPEWTVPSDPLESRIPRDWDWVQLLRDYCVQNAIPDPKYTKLSNARYTLDLQGSLFSGTSGTYNGDWDSQNGCAHMAMYSMLVFGNGMIATYPPVTLRNSNEQMLALIPRVPGGAASHAGVKRAPDDTTSASTSALASTSNASHSSSNGRKKRKTQNAPAPAPASNVSQGLSKSDKKRLVRRAKRARKAARKAQERLEAQKKTKATARTQAPQAQNASASANMVPVTNRRLAEVGVPEPKIEKRWPFSPKTLGAQLAKLQSRSERLQQACNLLNLEHPKIVTEQAGSQYDAAAHFSSDPFLTRAGPIGWAKGNGENAAREACSEKVVEYLVAMVLEDTEIEKTLGR
ncbi:hypothetical protein PHISP_06787 [Aspergillus sp. HF37]|nr:hypothetical protein PHISP_06787 [Aspergillus sp. HF37]